MAEHVSKGELETAYLCAPGGIELGEKNYVCTRLRGVKLTKAIKQLRHDTRKRKPSYLERSPDSETYVFRKSGSKWKIEQYKNDEATKQLEQEMRDYVDFMDAMHLEKHNKRRRKNANDFLVGIVTFSDPSITTEAELHRCMRKFLMKLGHELNSTPYMYVVHRDEKVLHFHYYLPAFDHDARSNTRKLTAKYLSHVQDLVASCFPMFQRGERVALPRRYYTVREAHRREAKEVQQLQEKKTQLKQVQAFLERHITQLKKSHENLAVEIATQKSTLEELKKEIKARKEERKAFIKKLQATKAEAEERKRQIREFDAETKRLRVQKKAAQATIAKLKTQESTMLRNINNLEAKLEKLSENDVLALESICLGYIESDPDLNLDNNMEVSYFVSQGRYFELAQRFFPGYLEKYLGLDFLEPNSRNRSL